MTRYPLGYRKIVLCHVFGYGLRLHIWSGPTVEDPHTHRWAFVAVPLRGWFVDRRYTTQPGSARTTVAAWPDRGTGRRYTPAGQSGLTRTTTHARRPLRPWRCRTGEIHSLIPHGPGPHWSLVAHGREQAPSSTIWRTP